MNPDKEPVPLQTNTNDSVAEDILNNINNFTKAVESGNIFSANSTEIAQLYAGWALQKQPESSSATAESVNRAIRLFKKIVSGGDSSPANLGSLRTYIDDALKQTDHPSLTKTKESWAELTGVEPTSDNAQIYDFPNQTPSDPQE